MVNVMRHSHDIRTRVIDFVDNGGSKAEAARRFQVSIRSVFYWLKQGRGYQSKKPGPKGARKLNRDKLIKLVEANPDMMLKELAQELGMSINAVFHSLKVLGYSRKKNGTLQREKTLYPLGHK